MSYEYWLDPRANCAFVRYFEPYTVGEGVSLNRSISNSVEFTPGMNILKDYSPIRAPEGYDYDFAFSQARRLVEIDAGMPTPCQIALVASTDPVYGFLRQLAILTAENTVRRAAFRCLVDACEWLGLPRDYPVRFSPPT